MGEVGLVGDQGSGRRSEGMLEIWAQRGSGVWLLAVGLLLGSGLVVSLVERVRVVEEMETGVF